MNKLKKKVFFTIFGLLSIFTITILGIYNYLNYNQEYKSIKNRGVTENDDLLKNNSNNEVETEIYIINTKTHQIYFPHGIFADNVMYITF